MVVDTLTGKNLNLNAKFYDQDSSKHIETNASEYENLTNPVLSGPLLTTKPISSQKTRDNASRVAKALQSQPITPLNLTNNAQMQTVPTPNSTTIGGIN